VKKVLLISMPFASIQFPSMGASLLKSILSEEKISCDIKYLNIIFAEMTSLEKYEWTCRDQGGRLLIGERLFAQEFFGNQLPDEKEYIEHLKQADFYTNQSFINNYLYMKHFVRPFLAYCVDSIKWKDYDIIGFSTMFEQNLASIALAYRIKHLDPMKFIVFGGANCEGEMGVELLRCFPFIDFALSGEADVSFPKLIKRLRTHKSVESIPGLIYRKNNKTEVVPSLPVNHLNALPYPDYDDYFNQIEETSFTAPIGVELPMETSRGCWWGEKSQCTFCGLNGCSIIFRSKSEKRVLNELRHLVQKYVKKYKETQVVQISMTDNILNMKYFKTLIPELGVTHLNVPLFWETKANLNKEQIQMLINAGITNIQPGIESLSTHVLRLMRKGVTAIQNIQLLKFCKQFNIDVVWNILFGFPGEKIKDYTQMVELIYKITHLRQPDGHTCFELDRFSPYFEYPDKYGIECIRPKEAYRYIYPFEKSILFKLSYYFDFDYRDDVKPPNYKKELSEAVAYWNECDAYNENLYSIASSRSALLIEDGRSNAIIPRILLEFEQKDIYEYCDQIRNFSSIFSYIRKKYGNFPIRTRDVRDFLEEMVSLNLMVSEGNKYLSLAIPVEGTLTTQYNRL
jgi:ribosomal peptide maturation radical SAM protein 1